MTNVFGVAHSAKQSLSGHGCRMKDWPMAMCPVTLVRTSRICSQAASGHCWAGPTTI